MEKVKIFRVIGWHKNITPANRSSTTLSDGAIFSSLELAKGFWHDTGMTLLHIGVYMSTPDNPEIDYLIEEGLYTPTGNMPDPNIVPTIYTHI